MSWVCVGVRGWVGVCGCGWVHACVRAHVGLQQLCVANNGLSPSLLGFQA